ncbi:uncharacterized protein Z520_01208 [Fonsecaea multimorphosa CBS 102226]|uniref:Oxidoreductase-like protein n=1 Tax=Fonsecaea multimorphosa CBS 102226 TaxID=1442371 RepID=A0A0D2K9K9_9EURO|nr:uncharacterized protein Z520_01208 [Fonsecaea multimorphosa CBS 102226]KIY02743.1 hypothetical protein Z520_01208 [Fonsecaea multimorphosa CBS 102226]OAL31166.1 hypothetical protein AYO22_01199 [Fonsecaea multimorphosa]
MNAPVEAQSISSLNNLLANPPRYPRNPTHEVHESLVLYIVRVPGSKDVFLTPLKPATKASISIEAVQSSLYFLHVERPEDKELKKSLEAAQATEDRSHEVPPIQRKPLPPTPHANYPASRRPPTPPKSYPHYQPPLPESKTANQAERYSARGTHLRLNTRDNLNAPLTSGKPLGSRLMPSKALDCDENSSPSSIDNAQTQFELARKPLQPALLSGSHGHNRSDIDQEFPFSVDLDHGLQHSNFQPPGSMAANPQSGTLRITLIRRDPASGSQWNVGSIVQQTTEAPLRKVDIELTSPGYNKFVQLEAGGGVGFRRKVAYMPSDDGSSLTMRRGYSTETFSGASQSASRRPKQTYAFISPWQGTCVFGNGLDGKSLRCRHFLPGANPSMPGVSADIAELRFNLPWASLRLKDPNKKQANHLSDLSNDTSVTRPEVSSNKEQWRRSFQTLTHRARKQLSISDNNGSMEESAQFDKPSEQNRLSLDLGREKAGGGFKGHSAKLGKLIINDEGLKMCDLVVAACMGVWWQHYAGDRSSY